MRVHSATVQHVSGHHANFTSSFVLQGVRTDTDGVSYTRMTSKGNFEHEFTCCLYVTVQMCNSVFAVICYDS